MDRNCGEPSCEVLFSERYYPDGDIESIIASRCARPGNSARGESLEETLDELRETSSLQIQKLSGKVSAAGGCHEATASRDSGKIDQVDPDENCSGHESGFFSAAKSLPEAGVRGVDEEVREAGPKEVTGQPKTDTDFEAEFRAECRQRFDDLRRDLHRQIEDISLRVSKLEHIESTSFRGSRIEGIEDMSLRVSKLEHAIANYMTGDTLTTTQSFGLRVSSDSGQYLPASESPEAEASKSGSQNRHSLYSLQPSDRPSKCKEDDLIKMSQEFYDLKASIWDAALFIGMPRMGAGGSAVMFVGLLMNIFIQVAWILLIQEHFSEQFFTASDLEGLRSWRYSVAHDQSWVNGQDSPSLAARVCGHDKTLSAAYAQVETLGVIEDFLVQSTGRFEAEGNGLLNGPLMASLALACWCLSVTGELKQTISFILALTKLPTGDHTSILRDEVEDRLELRQIKNWRKLWGIFVIACGRGLIALLLGLYGCNFIIGIVEMQELLLNAVALEFILTIDELVFASLAPTRTKTLLRKVKPLPVRKWPGIKGVDIQEIILLLGLFSILAVLDVYYGGESVLNLESAWDTMCAGNLNFMYNTDSLGLHWVNMDLPPFVGDAAASRDHHRALVMGEAIYESDVRSWRAALIDPSFSRVKGLNVEPEYVAAQRIRENMLKIEVCNPPLDDLFQEPTRHNWPNEPGPRRSRSVATHLYRGYRSFFQAITGNGTIATCADLEPYCALGGDAILRKVTLATRSWCPVTCGCNNPIRGVALIGETFGCPSVCVALLGRETSKQRTCFETDPQGPAQGVLFDWVQELTMESEIGLESRDLQLLQSQSCADLTPSHALCYDPSARDTESFKTLLTMCPVACGCQRFNSSERQPSCPTDCYDCIMYLDADASDKQIISECRWDSDVPNPWYVDSWLRVTVVAHNIDGLCCRLLQRHANHSFLNLPSGLEAATNPDILTMWTLCSPCRREICVRSIGEASVNITRSLHQGTTPMPVWSVVGGKCTVNGLCVRSSNYPLEYDPDDWCMIQFTSNQNHTVVFPGELNIEFGYDNLIIDGVQATPDTDAIEVYPGSEILWSSDYSLQDTGWEICAAPLHSWSGYFWAVGDFFTAWKGMRPSVFAGAASVFSSIDAFIFQRCEDFDPRPVAAI